MDSERTSQILAIAAAVLLVVNVGVLIQEVVDDPASVTVDADGTDVAGDGGADGGQDAIGDGATTGQDGEAAGDGGTDGDASGDGTTDGSGGSDGDGSGGDGSDGDGSTPGAVALTAPLAGTYTYASAGTWGFSDESERQLPATAQATVTVGADAWTVELVAGQMYEDSFTFSFGADGLDWRTWTLGREYQGRVQDSPYTCEGDAPHHVVDNAEGRTTTLSCASGPVASSGTVVSQGIERVTLADGTQVDGVHLVFEYTDGGEFDGGSVTGGGRIDLWLDPATGLRLREVRSGSSTTSLDDGREIVYRENVEFTLLSLDPSAG